jgi:hypothetical protein
MLRNYRPLSRERGFGPFFDRVTHKLNPSADLRRVWDQTFNANRFNPTEVWQVITSITCDPHYGTSKHADKTGDTYQWFQKFTDKFRDIDAPAAANFILEGRYMLLEAYRGDICDEQRNALAEYYGDLVNNDAFANGWNHLYRSRFLPNLMHGDSTLISSLVSGITDPVFGAVAVLPLEANQQHLFVTEYENFVKSDAFQKVDPSIKILLINQVQADVLPRLGTNQNAKLDQIFKDLYITTVDNSSEGYGISQANRITMGYDPMKVINEDVQMAAIRQNSQTALNQLETLLTDPAVGVGGKDEEMVERTIKLFNDTVTAISRRHGLVQGVFFDVATERILKILETTKHERVKELYEELANEKLKKGQEYMAFRKLDPEKASEFVNQMMDRIDNPIYGEGGEQELTSVFVDQVDRFLDEVGGQSTLEQTPIYEAIVERVKSQIATKGDTKKSKALAQFFDKAIARLGDEYIEGQKEYMFNVSDFESTQEFNDAVAANLESARENMDIDGELPADVVELVTEQTRQAFLESPIREVWGEYIEDVSNEKYGQGSSIVDLSDKIKGVFKRIKDKVKGLSPEKQYLFYKVGKEQLLLTLKEKNASNMNHQAIVEEVQELLTSNDFSQGKEYEKEVLMTQADRLAENSNDRSRARFDYYTNVWDNYLNDLYDPAITQGTYTDVKIALKADFEKLMTNLSTAEYDHTGPFLRAGYKSYIKKLKELKDGEPNSDDARQRLVFDTFALLSHSTISEMMEKKENDFAVTDLQGAKMVRTLGRIQVEFIMEAIGDRQTLGLFFPYIETKLREGLFKDQKEERLCVTMLMMYRDTQRKRLAGNGRVIQGVDGAIDLGFPPEVATLMDYQGSVTASLESSTSAIEGGHLNAFLEVLAAIGDLSPYTLVRLAGESTLNRLLKNTRKFGHDDEIGDKRAEIITNIKNSNLSAAEKFYLIYTSTGKMDFELEIARQLGKDKSVEAIIREAVKSRDGKDLLAHYFTYKDDICQVTTVPGLQAILGDQFEEGKDMVALRKSIFEKYFSTAIYRIKSNKFNRDGKLSKIAATELMALSMMLEKTPGEDERVKDANFTRIFSDLLIDIVTSKYYEESKTKYSQEVFDMAWKVLNYSAPYWSEERVQILVDSFSTRVKTSKLDTWIEDRNWKDFIRALSVVSEGLLPLGEEIKGTNIRAKNAEIVIDATLDILDVYDVIGGRSALRSPIDIITGEQSNWPEHTNFKVAKTNNFIEQSIGMTCFIGTEEQKAKLREILVELARRDNLRYAWKEDMMPDMPAEEFLSTSEKMVLEMRNEVAQVETGFAALLDSAVKGSRTYVHLDDEGRVQGLADKSKLLEKIEAGGKDAFEELIKRVKINSKLAQARSFGNRQLEGLESLNGVEFADLILKKSQEYSGDDADFKQKIFAVLEKFAVEGGSKEVKEASEAAQRIGVNVEKMAGFGTMAALMSKLSGASAVQGILEAYFQSDKGFGVNVIKDVLEKSGYKTSVEEVEKIRQVIVQGLNQVLTDANMRQEAVMGMRRAEELAFGTDLALVGELRHKYWKNITGSGGAVLEKEMEIINTELDQLQAEIKTRHTARAKVVEKFETALPAAAEKLAEMQKEYTEVSVQKVNGFFEWLNKVSSPRGNLAKRSRKYASTIVTTHYVTAINSREMVQLDMTKLMPTAKEILQSMGLFDAYKQYVPQAWLAAKPLAA